MEHAMTVQMDSPRSNYRPKQTYFEADSGSLPKANQLRNELSEMFEFEFYKEHPIGPPTCKAVTVRLVAKRKAS